MKNATYPVTGALLGSLVGGPLGLVVGFKAGGLAALGCGIAGYTGGKIFKKYNDKVTTEEEKVMENDDDQMKNAISESDSSKKDI